MPTPIDDEPEEDAAAAEARRLRQAARRLRQDADLARQMVENDRPKEGMAFVFGADRRTHIIMPLGGGFYLED